MMRKMLLASVVSLVSAASAGEAAAQIDEIRLGAAAHNIVDESSKEEDGVNVNGELVFGSPRSLKFLGRPRLYIMASANTAGETNWAGVGLYWRWEFADRWAFEPGFGYVLHDGWKDTPYPRGDPRNDARILLGSKDLFRETVALERQFGARFAMQIFFEHLSHGQIIGSGRNEGTEDLGARAIWKFRDQ